MLLHFMAIGSPIPEIWLVNDTTQKDMFTAEVKIDDHIYVFSSRGNRTIFP